MANQQTETLSPVLIVIFGASGDLTKRKLIPALHDLYARKLLPENFAVVGTSRTKMSDDEFRAELYDFAKKKYKDEAQWKAFSGHVYYQPGDATKADDMPALKKRLEEVSAKHGTGQNFIFYLSMAPQFFEPTIVQIGAAGLVTEGKQYCAIDKEHAPFQRIVVEKPFGSDPKSATRLNQTLASVFEEEQIYRIDHYLGKELVQNLLVVRFANAIFEPIWNNVYIDHVQITATETVGVEGRGAYYDGPAGGAMRDMVQSHLLQVLSVVAMEPPVSMKADDIRTEKIKIFKAMRIPSYNEVPQIAVRGQYGPGQVDGKAIPSYRAEKGVDAASQTDTYAAMKLLVDTWRWGGVPFYLRSGKALAKKLTEIVIYFKPTPHCLFRKQAAKMKPNQIIINVQPNEGIFIRFEGKVPGSGLKIKEVMMDFDYVEEWKAEPGDGYATLLHDCIRGDLTLFKHRDEIDIGWQAVQPVLDYWKDNPQDDLPNYAAGTWGPSASDVMLAHEERHWHNPQ